MSTLEEIDNPHNPQNALYKMGLFETLCFISSHETSHYFMIDGALYYRIGSPSRRSETMIEYWET